eukprot:CAMPEP_0114642136 /NCGR_PEP_ID=MMETSP0191-20121206/2659_1 /TAXON_ID=126664 /ORGANISM="Sorites sp." /LENGTH=78 /DNA_ID=CAMNT_0001854283 /DNA_START=43 /DNA_END=276 /DNA_ORIENTATION=-
MAETNAQPQVVQAQVVQATVVGQPVGQAGYPQPVQAFGPQPGQAMYGQQMPYGAYGQYGQSPDQAGAQMGWMLYGIGW